MQSDRHSPRRDEIRGNRQLGKLGDDVVPYPSQVFGLASLNFGHRVPCCVVTRIPTTVLQAKVETSYRSKLWLSVYFLIAYIVPAWVLVAQFVQECIYVLKCLIERNSYSPVAVN